MFDAYASLFRRYVNDLELSHQQVAEHRNKRGYPLTNAERETLRASLEDFRPAPPPLGARYSKNNGGQLWHASDSESEVMWRLYAENRKAVAVETTLDSLKESIQKRELSSACMIREVSGLLRLRARAT